MGQPSGFRWARPRWQWQSTLTAHDPNPPITLENGGTPPAVDGGLPWQVVDWLAWYDDEDGDFYAGVFEALVQPAIDPVFGLLEIADEDDEALDFGAPFTPGLNNFVPGVLDTLDEDEDEAPQVVAWIDPPAAPAVIDPVMGWAEALDEEDNESPWGSTFPHGAETGPNPVGGWYDVHDDGADEVIEAVFASVIAANDFVQGLLEVQDDEGDEGLFEALWNPAFDPDPPVVVPPTAPGSQGDDPSRIGRYRHTDLPARLANFIDLPEVSDESPAASRADVVPKIEPQVEAEAKKPESTALARSMLQDAREVAQASAQVALEAARQQARDRTLAIIIAIAEADDD